MKSLKVKLKEIWNINKKGDVNMYNNIKKDVIKYGLNKTIEECMLNIDLLLSIYNRRLIGYIKKGNKHLIELTGGLIVAYESNNKIDTITFIEK